MTINLTVNNNGSPETKAIKITPMDNGVPITALAQIVPHRHVSDYLSLWSGRSILLEETDINEPS